jgi:Rod binding domain-containing protein
MNPVTLVNHTATPSSPEREKALQAGTQFEAVLLNSLMGSLEHSFSHLPGGKKEDQASESYGGMAMQALTSGLARSGGIGVGKIIAAALLKNSHGGNHENTNR